MKLAIVGGGPAGIMAAIKAKETNPDTEVILIEQNEKIGKKLFITGKGRCNVTNNCSNDTFFKAIVTNPKFMFASFANFSCEDTLNFFNNNNCPLKTERGNRVFPESDKSSDIIKCFEKKLRFLKITILLNSKVYSIEKHNNSFLIKFENDELFVDKLIIATGGNFYKATGSTGDGYVFSKKFGHSIIPPKPSLIGLVTKQKHELAGLTLKNVLVTLYKNNKKIKEEFGELLFTHKGISGPTVLTLSTAYEKTKNDDFKISIDLKPALERAVLEKRLIKDFEELHNKELKNCLNKLLPSSLAKYIISLSKLNCNKQINSLTVPERKVLLDLIKHLTFDVLDVDNPDSAIITRGGVDVKEINPKTMESKLVNGLYFCGEILDLDAVTGGFNIQIALSTGATAGSNAVLY